MSYIDLIDRIKQKDPEAFLELTDRYGWSVYSVICENYSDPVVVDRIYNEIMNEFYHVLSTSSSEDPLEDILCAFARQSLPKNAGFSGTKPLSKKNPPNIQLSLSQLPEANLANSFHKNNGILHSIGFLIILLFFIATVWLVTGLLMIMEVIPYVDLGFNWLFGHIIEFF